jgi:hypothetical protein
VEFSHGRHVAPVTENLTTGLGVGRSAHVVQMQGLALIVRELSKAIDPALSNFLTLSRASYRHVRVGITSINLLIRNCLDAFSPLQALIVRFGTKYAAHLAMTLRRRVGREYGLYSCLLLSVGLMA